jgi:uncharacterized protein YqjF (DUF2071 family)
MHASLPHTSRQPWPLSGERWLWRQTWRDLAFIHYRIDKEVLRPRIPSDLTIDEYDGSAWVALVPFEMYDVMLGRWPSIPPLRRFPELNFRTYVHGEGRGGVWFFSLDTDCWPIVLGGRYLYHLPYFKAQMRHRAENGTIHFESRRTGGGPRFVASYKPKGTLFFPKSGTFEQWMAERYCLYTLISGETHRLEVHHRPWPIQCAEVTDLSSDMLESELLSPLDPQAICHYSPGVEVVTFKARKTTDYREAAVAASPIQVEPASGGQSA